MSVREGVRGWVNGRERREVVTTNGDKWIRVAYPDWDIIDSDDGMSVPGGTSYLLERRA